MWISRILMKCLGKNGFLHTNKRRSSTIDIIASPGLAQSLLTLTGTCRVYSVYIGPLSFGDEKDEKENKIK